jgi:hypothetical protein
MPIINVVLALIIVGIVVRTANDYLATPGSFKTILNVALGLMVVGMIMWLINTYVPMAGAIKAILNVVVVIAVCVRVLQEFGLWGDTVGLWSSFRHRSTAGTSGKQD